MEAILIPNNRKAALPLKDLEVERPQCGWFSPVN